MAQPLGLHPRQVRAPALDALRIDGTHAAQRRARLVARLRVPIELRERVPADEERKPCLDLALHRFGLADQTLVAQVEEARMTSELARRAHALRPVLVRDAIGVRRSERAGDD